MPAMLFDEAVVDKMMALINNKDKNLESSPNTCFETQAIVEGQRKNTLRVSAIQSSVSSVLQ